MPALPGESIRAQAAREGKTTYDVRDERAATRGLKGYGRETQYRRAFRRAVETAEAGPHGLQGPFGPSADDWDYYWPTRTRRPERKYTQFARFSRNRGVLEVVFRDGTPWHWDNVTESGWITFKREPSTYDFLYGAGAPINGYRVLDEEEETEQERTEQEKGQYGGWGNL